MDKKYLRSSVEPLFEFFDLLYGEKTQLQKDRYKDLFAKFKKEFNADKGYFVSSPGRVEICGNHTDHNGGMVLSTAISLDSLAVFLPRNDNKAVVFSEGYGKIEVDLDQDFNGKKGNSSAIIFGVKEGIKNHGYNFGGFNAYVTSNVLGGAGISSSASFELLIVEILNFLYNDEKIDNSTKAIISQYAEREYFGKPCGLLDQTAIAYGGLKKLDFAIPGKIIVEEIENQLKDYTLILINTGGSHENLTDEYASIPREMFSVAKCFNKERLKDVDKEEFYAKENQLNVCDRAIKRAEHFFEENDRVEKAFLSLKENDYKTFIDCINKSGESSLYKLQNCFVQGSDERLIVDALDRAKKNLYFGACRVHGGGFAGTTLNIIKNDKVNEFVANMKVFYKEENIICLKVRGCGAIIL